MEKEIMLKVTLDKVFFKQKPGQEDVAKIQHRFKNNNCIEKLPIQKLLSYIGEGCTLIPSVMFGGTKKENWIEQQLFEIDIDNANIGSKIVYPEEVINYLKEYNLPPFAYYYTFSSTTEKPKFRLLFKFLEPISDINKAEFIIKTLVNFIPQSDNACTNVSRLYYGTNIDTKKVIMLDENAVITLDEVVKIYKRPEEDKIINDNSLWEEVKNYDWLYYIKNKYLNEGRETDERYDCPICPICGHKNDFSYYKNTHTFCCFGKNGNIGGNFINYLVATENLSLKEAIDKFKYEILGLSKEEEKKQYLVGSGVEQEDLMVILNQLEGICLKINSINEVDWIKYKMNRDGDFIRIINCPRLAQFIRNNFYYIFVRDDAKSGVNRYFYLDGYYKLVTDDEVKGLIKSCIPLDWQNVKDINEVLNLLYTDLRFVSVDKLNRNENIINFKNGVLHLDTMELKPHSPLELTTIRIPCTYYEQIDSPQTHYFDKFIYDLTCGDEGKKLLLLEFMGVCLSNVYGYRMKKALFQIGDGDSGKSRLKVLLFNLLGKENCSSIDLRQLETQFGKSQLFNKRLVGTNDLGYMPIATLDTFKQATGGDYINIEFKHENSFDILFKGILWFCGNQLPSFSGDKGDWTYERMVVVECSNVIPKEKQDRELDNHLLEEADYIISLSIKALKKVINNGYNYDIPETCLSIKEKYKIDNDSFLSFYEECLTERDLTQPIDDFCTRGKIFEVYKAYCKDNNRNFFNTKKEVKKILEKMGKDETTYANGGNIYYKYITLTRDANKEYSYICPLPRIEETMSFYDVDYDS